MKKIILIISWILSIWLTSYISLLPLNWVNQADISNMYSTSITPSGFTFSIWSVIYLSWIILGIYSFFHKKNLKLKKREILILASVQLGTVLWLIPWHYDFIWISFLIMLGILWILSYLSTRKIKDKIFSATIYLFFGWILVAAIANLHIFLVSINFYIFPVIFWVISLFIWAIINYIFINKYNTIIPAAVFIWALIWIILNNANEYIIWTSYLIIFTLWLIILFQKKK